MTRWTDWYWLSWLIGVFGFFLPVEFWAIFSGQPQLTLSDTVWSWTDNEPGQAWNIGHYTWPHWLLASFLIWLTLHLCFRLGGHWLFILTGLFLVFYTIGRAI